MNEISWWASVGWKLSGSRIGWILLDGSTQSQLYKKIDRLNIVRLWYLIKTAQKLIGWILLGSSFGPWLHKKWLVEYWWIADLIKATQNWLVEYWWIVVPNQNCTKIDWLNIYCWVAAPSQNCTKNWSVEYWWIAVPRSKLHKIDQLNIGRLQYLIKTAQTLISWNWLAEYHQIAVPDHSCTKNSWLNIVGYQHWTADLHKKLLKLALTFWCLHAIQTSMYC